MGLVGGLCLAGTVFLASPVLAEERDPEELEEELLEDADFPDLVRVDETGGIMDEFDLLQEQLSDDEIVSASKHRQSIFWSPAAVTVFTREDIRASGAFTLPDLLRRVPGFDIYSMKTAYGLVGARAQTNQNNNLVLLLVDGREELVELTGYAFWEALSFDIEEIERVEVVRGPGSALYGANAVAAVVSVTTMADRPSGVEINATLAEAHRSYLSARYRDTFRLAGGLLSYSAGLGYVRQRPVSAPYTLDLDMFRSHNYVRFRYGSTLDLSLHAGATFGARASMYVFAGDMITKDIATPWLLAKADFKLSESSKLKTQFYFTHLRSDLEFRTGLRGYGIWMADFPEVLWRSETADGQVQFEQHIGEQLLIIAGANLRYSTLRGEGLILDDNDEMRGAGFVHLQWEPVDTLQLVGGARLDLNDLTRSAVSPRTALVFRPWKNQSLRLGYGLAFRKPSFFEVIMHLEVENFNPAFPEIVDLLATQVGNPDLKNTKMHSLEVGWQGRFLDDRLRFSVDLFYNIYRDTVSFLSEVPLRLGLPNLQEASISFRSGQFDTEAVGGEAAISWQFIKNWSVWANLGLREMEYTRNVILTDFEPKLRVNLGLRYFPTAGLFADLAVHYVSEYFQYLPDPADMVAVNEVNPLGDCALLIGRLGYRYALGKHRSMELGLTVRTPLGAAFREFDGVPMPPDLGADTPEDFGGEQMIRLLAVYLRVQI